MEIKKRLNSRKLFVIVYCFCFAVYLLIGLSPAEATDYEASTELAIPSINLQSEVTTVALGNTGLDTPGTIVGRYSRNPNKTLLFGHSSTVFHALDQVKIGDFILYDESNYRIIDIEALEKSEVKMRSILAEEDVDTLVLMTCAGTLFDNGDATERLIVTAVKQ